MTATGFIVTGMIPLVLAAVAVGPVTLVLHFCHHPAKQCAPELRGKKMYEHIHYGVFPWSRLHKLKKMDLWFLNC